MKETRLATIAYYSTLALFLVGWFLPGARLWGINGWAHFDSWTLAGVLLVFSLIPIGSNKLLGIVYPAQPKGQQDKQQTLKVVFYVVMTSILVAAAIFRTELHFLGDGYQVLSMMSRPEPHIKYAEIGETLIRLVLRVLCGGDTSIAALCAYRLASFSAGVLFVLSVVYFSARFFKDQFEKLLFATSIVFGGYTFLFFGYVEHYSFMVAVSTAFCLFAVIALEAKISPVWTYISFALAVFLHLSAIALTPALVYFFLARKGTTERLLGTNRRNYVATILAGLALLILVGQIARAYSLYFKFALLPLIPDQFTIDHYHLFSLSHLTDLLNLAMLLLPGLPVLLLLVLLARPLKTNTRFGFHSEMFLAACACSCWTFVFLMDPKLGMPRDWDLFALAGPPTMLLLLVIVFNRITTKATRAHVLLLASALGLFALAPRVATWRSPDIGTKRIVDYYTLDRSRNRTGWDNLYTYYDKRGDKETANQVNKRWHDLFPEYALLDTANSVGRGGDLNSAANIYRRILQINPGFSAAYTNLGYTFFLQNSFDSALSYLEIANAVTPNNPDVLRHLSRVHAALGDSTLADELLAKSVRLSP